MTEKVSCIKPEASPDYMLECQLATQAAEVIASHFSRPKDECLMRIISQIREQVENSYKFRGI